MKITAQDLLRFGIIDTIIAEPAGGAHRDPAAAIQATGKAITVALDEFKGMSADAIRKARADKFLAMGRNIAV
jgi:acetyl-CoA carboxylase carboxyl transferase subunit alpha